MQIFKDGISSLTNALINSRNSLRNNEPEIRTKLSMQTLRSLNKSGMFRKIVSIKSNAITGAELVFSKNSADAYKTILEKQVKRAVDFMIGYGRGIVVVYYHGEDWSKPFSFRRGHLPAVRTFSGDLVTVNGTDYNVESENYLKPDFYNVRGKNIHHSRVVDFKYVEPPEFEAQSYFLGGISAAELIYDQLIADGIVERATASTIERVSTLFYKVKGFKSKLQQKQEDSIVKYFSKIESLRSVYGAGLLDEEDSIEVHNQTFAGIKEIQEQYLRRLALVTGIPVSWLVGESVRGLNSTGENENEIFWEMIRGEQRRYFIDCVNELLYMLDLGTAELPENQGEMPSQKVDFETKVLNNATLMDGLGQDFESYLKQKGLVLADPFQDAFGSTDSKNEKKEKSIDLLKHFPEIEPESEGEENETQS